MTLSDDNSNLGSLESKAVASKTTTIMSAYWSARRAQCGIVVTPNHDSDDEYFCEGGDSND